MLNNFVYFEVISKNKLVNKIFCLLIAFCFFVACKPEVVPPTTRNQPMNTPATNEKKNIAQETTTINGAATVGTTQTTTSSPSYSGFECGTTSTGVNPSSIIINTPKQYSILALGDSYTIGESVSANQRYPVQMADSLKKLGYDVKDPKIIARTGWTTDELQNAIVADGDTGKYDFVFLLIGVNNQYRGRPISSYTPQLQALLSTALGFAGNDKTHVFVISIPDYGYTPFGASNQTTISAGIDAYNAENKAQADALGVNYINITDISRSGAAGLVAGDGLHPSGLQYKKWVEKIIPVIKNYLP